MVPDIIKSHRMTAVTADQGVTVCESSDVSNDCH
jgi:hypothetical protein